MSGTTRLIALTVGVVSLLGLTACSFGAPGPAAQVTGAETSQATGSATSTADPEVDSARTKFDDANRTLASSGADVDDTAIVNGLTAAGFDRSAMQVTRATTTVGRTADSVQVSVRVGGTCLLGEFRGSSYVSETAPVLATGRCLVGTTAPIG